MLLVSRNTSGLGKTLFQKSSLVSRSVLNKSTSSNHIHVSRTVKKQFSTSSSASSTSATDPLFKYNIAVAFAPKERDEDFDLVKNPTGEDNYVLFQKDSNLVLGVADGVGGWSEVKNCSSADMSRELCASTAKAFNESLSLTKNASKISPVDLLSVAYKDIQIDNRVKVGGTTICFGVLPAQSNTLKVLNLGDSWCGLFRNFKCVQQTKFQTHGFNTPYQLSVIPEEMQKAAAKQNRRYILDMPHHADVYDFKLKKNDVVVFATDGLTDNIVPEDIEVFLRDEFNGDINGGKADLQNVADKLVLETKQVAANPHYPSPFSQELSALTGQNYSGGKKDDITVVILKVE